MSHGLPCLAPLCPGFNWFESQALVQEILLFYFILFYIFFYISITFQLLDTFLIMILSFCCSQPGSSFHFVSYFDSFFLFVGFFFFLSLSFFLWVLLSDHDDDEIEVEDDDDEHDSYKDNRNRHIQLINWSQRALQAAMKSGLPDLDVKQTDAENWCSILNELIHFDWHSHFLTKYWVTEYFFLCVSIRPGNVTLRTFREPVRRQKVLKCFITNSILQLVRFRPTHGTVCTKLMDTKTFHC